MVEVDFKYLDLNITIYCPNNIDRFFKVYSEDRTFYELRYLEALFHNYEKLFNSSKLNCIDVGACLGNHTVYFSKILNANVFAFEPRPLSYQFLQENITVNCVESKCHTFNNCVSSIPGKFKIKKQVDHMIGCTEWEPNVNGDVDSVSLDEIISCPVHLIKIDVEGMEIDVLKSATRIIREYSPVIMIEISRVNGIIVHQAEFDQWLIDNEYEYLYPEVFNRNTYLIRKITK